MFGYLQCTISYLVCACGTYIIIWLGANNPFPPKGFPIDE